MTRVIAAQIGGSVFHHQPPQPLGRGRVAEAEMHDGSPALACEMLVGSGAR